MVPLSLVGAAGCSLSAFLVSKGSRRSHWLIDKVKSCSSDS